MIASRRARRPWRCAAIIASALLLAPPAFAQDSSSGRSTIRDVVIGAPLADQPADFQEYACGTNGGPPSRPLARPADFALCPPEPSGLHEVQFRYDDELHYVALAQRDLLRAELFQGTRLGNFEILASMLVDDAGIVRGIRAVTDDRVSDRARRMAYSMGDFARTLYGAGAWDCVDLAVGEGETAVGNSLIKQDCTKVEGGLFLATSTRLYRRAGQTQIDPVNGQVRAGYYISTARLDIFAADAAGNPVHGGAGSAAAIAATPPPDRPADPRAAFLAGFTIDCPGCDLAGADLARRDLAGADLSGADLAGASLHRALLGAADLGGASLAGANLNLADLKRASLVAADLSGAFLFRTDAAAADFSGATLTGAIAETARFTNATLVGARLGEVYGPATNFAGADLTGANLAGAELPEADFQRAILAGADLTDVFFFATRLRAADLTDAVATRADFFRADLSDAILAGADLTEARLQRARVTGLDLTGAILTGTIMPDGSVNP